MSDDNTSGLGEFDGYQYDVVPDFVNQVNQDNVLADEGVTDGVDHGICSAFYLFLSDFSFLHF